MLISRNKQLNEAPETVSDKVRKNKEGLIVASDGVLLSAVGSKAVKNIIYKSLKKKLTKKELARGNKMSPEVAKEMDRRIRNISDTKSKLIAAGAIGASLAAGKIVANRKTKHKSINDDEIKNKKYEN